MGKSFKSETFSNSKALNLVFVFGPISVRSHLVLETWKLFSISFWNLGNFSPFCFGSLKRGQETGNQRSRTGSRRSRATGSFLTRVDSFWRRILRASASLIRMKP
jgi:hypothetical protein